MLLALLIASSQKVQTILQTIEFDWDGFFATLLAMTGNRVVLK